jgi:Domain of unknown function (DUF4185)
MVHVRLVPDSLRRVCQLTGEHDRTSGGPVPSLTASRYGLTGTDLGSSVVLGDRLVFLFGDTAPDRLQGDTVAWTKATGPVPNLELTFEAGVPEPHGFPPVFDPPRFKTFELHDPHVPSGRRTTGAFEVPTGGFAWQERRRLYVVYSQGHRAGPGPTMLSSVMCRTDDPNDLTQLSVLYQISRVSDGHFINAAPVVHRNRRGPWMVYFWGSGDYRKSDVFLARVPLADIDDPRKTAWRYWSGTRWDESESNAAALFRDETAGVGELSAAWLAPLGRWLITYHLGDNPIDVWFRTSQNPTGPYSAPQRLFHKDWPGVGAGVVMHRSWDEGGALGTDLLYDLGRGEEGGATYGPYLVSRFIRADGPGRARIAFTLSTWNPYQVHLFTATLELSDRPTPYEPAHQPRFEAEIPPLTEPDGVSMIESTFGPGNFELAAPAADGAMRLRSRENTLSGRPWAGMARIGPGPRDGHPVHYGAVSLIQSDLGNRGDVTPVRNQRLYLAARCGDRVVYLWREASAPWTWHGPYPVIAVELDDRRFPFAGAAGNVALVRSNHDADHQNWELVAPAAQGGGVLHFWRQNSPDREYPVHDEWRLAPRFLQGLGTVDALTMIESQLARGQYALEVVARVGSQLWFAWRNEALQWAEPRLLEVEGHPLFDASGTPSLIQSRYGALARNFELVTPRAGGGLLHLWRDNDSDAAADWRWRAAAPVFGLPRHYTSVSLIQGSLGVAPGNLELAARADDGQVVHFWRSAITLEWREAGSVL